MIPEKAQKKSYIERLKGRVPQWFVDALVDYTQQNFSNDLITYGEDCEGDHCDVSA